MTRPTPPMTATADATHDVHVRSLTRLITPNELKRELPIRDAAAQTVVNARRTIKHILLGEDPRLLAVVGPCSIHDEKAALDYAERLNALREEVAETIFVIMRVYFEKPRTTVGWKGLIYDPHLNDTFDISEGLTTARRILETVNEMGLPAGTEFLDPFVPQYIADLVSWAAIGARTTESQTHRQVASGLSMPIGFKNTTSGAVQPAVNAIRAASERQTFLGVDPEGRACSVTTKGNPNCHVILRGGTSGPNYGNSDVTEAGEALQKAGLIPALLIDCSHANSAKKPERQPEVFAEVISQRTDGNPAIIGSMIESNLKAGNQSFPRPRNELERGVSITDGCIGWESTREAVLRATEKLAAAG